MKKYLAIMICAGLLLTATGCGDEKKEEDSSKESTKVEEKAKNKVLNCSQTYGDTMTMTSTFLYDLDGKNISKATIDYTLLIEDDDIEIDEESVSSFCDEFNDESVKKCDARINGDKLLATLDYDIDKLDEDEEGFTKDTPIGELKAILEAESDEDFGVTCNIEEE